MIQTPRYFRFKGSSLHLFRTVVPAPGFLFKETLINVIPAHAGIYHRLIFLDSRLRGSDGNRVNQSFLKCLTVVLDTES